MHAGSLNHGCEAIVRSTIPLTNDGYVLFSEYPQEDHLMRLDDLCEVMSQGHSRNKGSIGFIAVKGLELIIGSSIKYEYLYKNIFSVSSNSLFLSIGGDNYCYDNNRNLAYINKKLHNQGHKTGLWGCSIEPSSLKNPETARDILLYDFITARESLTYHALCDIGHKNVYLVPDTAFLLNARKPEFNKTFFEKKVVGINMSPLIEHVGKDGLLFKNYELLIDWIIKNTDLNIALIPHVCKPGNDDRTSMNILAESIKRPDRMILINSDGDMDCEELKYIIGKCSFMVAARTHASIAAYSQMIPTIVVGYSVKALGIAKDIFHDDDNYIIDSRVISSEKALRNEFIKLFKNEQQIKKQLNYVMKDYIARAKSAADIIVRYRG